MSDPRAAELLMLSGQMSTQSGRDFVWLCLRHTSLFCNIFNVDPVLHAYNAGKREHGLWLERELKEAAPDQYMMMLMENQDG